LSEKDSTRALSLSIPMSNPNVAAVKASAYNAAARFNLCAKTWCVGLV
jgi:hypothetical protein